VAVVATVVPEAKVGLAAKVGLVAKEVLVEKAARAALVALVALVATVAPAKDLHHNLGEPRPRRLPMTQEPRTCYACLAQGVRR
jgi:hypothetical protein